MLWRPSGALNQLEACGIVQRAADGVLDLYLSAQEVAEGGMITISLYVPVRCADCAGASCSRCHGSATQQALFSAWLTVVPGAADGTELRPSVPLPGMLAPVVFRLRIAGRR